ncbi:MAG TPA: hypothetical protein VFX02_05995 [Gammaproteobacteria bacterium]|nr:hypothetical protein [Gammaproteobacteria bacterium]
MKTSFDPFFEGNISIVDSEAEKGLSPNAMVYEKTIRLFGMMAWK